MRLDTYITLKRQLDIKRNYIAALRESSGTTLSDTVKGSLSQFPYTQATLHIEGKDFSEDDIQIALLEEEIKNLSERASEALEELETYIDSIADPIAQTMLRCRYVQGYSIRKTADIINADPGNTFRDLQKYRVD